MEPNEELLIAAARNRDIDAFAGLVAMHQGYLRAYLGTLLVQDDIVDDLAQESLLLSYRKLEVYDGRAPFRIWLVGIARKMALEHLRKESRRLAREGAHLESVLAERRLGLTESNEGAPERHERRMSAMRVCLEQLPQRSAEAVRRFYFQGESAELVASHLAIQANAVHQLLHRIRQALRQCVELRVPAEEARR